MLPGNTSCLKAAAIAPACYHISPLAFCAAPPDTTTWYYRPVECRPGMLPKGGSSGTARCSRCPSRPPFWAPWQV